MTHNDFAARASAHPVDLTRASAGVRHVFIRDLCIDARVGVFRHEKDVAQPVRINVDLAVRDPGPNASDRLGDVVDYGEVVARIDAVIAAGHVNLIETLAEKIASDCLEDERVLGVRVRIEKPRAISRAESVGIELERHRTA